MPSIRTFWWIVALCFTFLLSGLVLYFLNFHSDYSKASSDWSNFATFISLFINVISLVLLATISFITFLASNRYNQLQLRPHIYLFEATRVNALLLSPRTWQMTNRSSVPAINVLVRYCFNRDEQSWTNWIICFSLGPNLTRELGWVNFADIIEICYTNIENSNSYLYNFKEYTGEERTITQQEYLSNLREAQGTCYPYTPEVITTNNLTENVINFYAQPVIGDFGQHLRNLLIQ